MKKAGIYEIVAPSGNSYVGSSNNVKGRLTQHKSLLKRSIHECLGLQRAANKYGIDNLIFRILLVCSEVDLLLYEQRALDILKPRYNRRKIADRNSGLVVSPETREKISRANTGRMVSNEHRAMLSIHFKNMIRTPEHCKKIGEAQLGRVFSAETRAKMSAAKSGRPASVACLRAVSEYWSGRKHNDETIEKMKASAKVLWAKRRLINLANLTQDLTMGLL